MDATNYFHAIIMMNGVRTPYKCDICGRIESSQTPQTLYGIKSEEKRKKTVLTVNTLELFGGL